MNLRDLRYLVALADERDAEVLLELAHLRGQRRLTHEAALRRLAEMALVGQGHEVAKIPQVHA